MEMQQIGVDLDDLRAQARDPAFLAKLNGPLYGGLAESGLFDVVPGYRESHLKRPVSLP